VVVGGRVTGRLAERGALVRGVGAEPLDVVEDRTRAGEPLDTAEGVRPEGDLHRVRREPRTLDELVHQRIDPALVSDAERELAHSHPLAPGRVCLFPSPCAFPSAVWRSPVRSSGPEPPRDTGPVVPAGREQAQPLYWPAEELTGMPRDDRTHVEEWADLVGERVPEEVTRDRRDRRDRWTDRE